ncbi:MAG: hypothetical protein AB7S75_25435 [Desulfococcaceae bacterium]
MQNNDNDIEEIISRPMTDEERYYAEQFCKELVESVKRIEETAKYLIGSSSATSGLYLAAFKLSFGDAKAQFVWLIPFLCWTAAIVFLILTLLPRKYETGKNEPASYKAAFMKARTVKYHRLGWGAGFFVLGILTAAYPFVK